jgi:NADH-quinone oxidoreductase subunit A
MFDIFFPIGVLFVLATITVLIMMYLPELVARKSRNRRKLLPYECGIVPQSDARERFPVKFYLIAILFIIFDLETVFLYPWAIILKKLKMFAFIEMAVFIGILLLGYLYIVKKGALNWE